ncbi:MAG: hypothetical protein D3M94_17190 [Rhodocyclales bacterium GT-UBC]|nr:MAG: hypothetical protein D3M94_17190 [Rhodocyclales bacterium GT-UBC]
MDLKQKLRRLLLIAGTCLLAPAWADSPPPSPLPGEQVRYEDVPFREQFAPPLAGPDNSLYVFTEAARWQIWPLEAGRVKRLPLAKFEVPVGPRIGYSENYPARYASLATAQGHWLIGPSLELIRPDGSRLSGRLKWPRHQIKAVDLADGSILVIGGYSWPEKRDYSANLKLERVWLDAGNRIQSEELPPIPLDLKGPGSGELYGYGAVRTANGQLLLAGSEYHNISLLFDPEKRSWRKLTGLPRPRNDPALTLLPDGRIWATGGSGWRMAETTSELWNPQTQTWSPGPDLPVPMVDHRAVLNDRRDTVLLAGGYHPAVLGWKMGKDGVFVAARHGEQRRLAGVVGLPGDRLVLTGGRHARDYGEGWGRSTAGLSVLNVDSNGSGTHLPVWPITRSGALLERQGQLFAIGGLLHHAHNGSEDDNGSRLVERFDTAKGLYQTLPPLPLVAGPTQAAWISEQEILVHAENVGREQDNRQWLGLLNPRSGALRTLPLPTNPTYIMSDGIHRKMQLVGAHAGRAWLIAEDGEALRVSPRPPHYEPALRLQRQRRDFSGRVLADGRVVIAGGQVESELVAARPANCKDCPTRYLGFGPQLPARRHEIYDPQAATWSSSAPSRAAGGPVGIFADGAVAKLGELSERKGEAGERTIPLLEIADPTGKSWRSLPLPGDFPTDVTVANAYLHTLRNDNTNLPRALFLGAWSSGEIQWWWLDDIDTVPNTWRPFGKAVPPYTFPPGEIATGKKNERGQPIVLQGGAAGVIAYPRP